MDTRDEIYFDKGFYQKHKKLIDQFAYYANLDREWSSIKLINNDQITSDHYGAIRHSVVFEFSFKIDPFKKFSLNDDGYALSEGVLAVELFGKWDKLFGLNHVPETQQLWKQILNFITTEDQEVDITFYNEPADTKYYYCLIPKNIQRYVHGDSSIKTIDMVTKHFYVVNGTKVLLPLLDLYE